MPPAPTPNAQRTDAELIRAARRDPGAFEALMERHAARLDRWLRGQTRDATAAHELMAETFAQAWLSARRFRGAADDADAGGAWLYGIARNLLRQHMRRGRLERRARERLGIRTAPNTPDESDEVAERLDAERLAPAVNAALAELREDQREAIDFRVLRELSYEELAEHLNCSPITARSRVFRGLRSLRSTVARGAST